MNRLQYARLQSRWAAEAKSRQPDDENKPSAYENRNEVAYYATNGRVGMPIPLYPRGVFWSRGWRGCPQCSGSVLTHRPNVPYHVRSNGVIRAGWSCTGKPGIWES